MSQYNDIKITPNSGVSSDPKIEFTGAGNSTITLKVTDGTSGEIVFENEDLKELLSLVDGSSTDPIFSVNDSISLPALQVYEDGRLLLAPYAGYNIGIGTTNPTSKLSVTGVVSVTGGITFKSDLDTYITGDGSDAIQVYTSGVEKLRIDSSGRVGIGTATPADTNNFGNALDVNGTAGSALYVRTGGSATNFGMFGHSGTTAYVMNQSNGPLTMWTNNSEKARITSDGKLGLGTSSPQELLDVAGNGASFLRWEHDGANGSYSTSGGVLRIGPYYADTDRELALFMDNANQAWVTTGSAQVLNIGTNKTSHILINTIGNVGVGTTLPGANLDVVGKIRASTGILFGSDTANDNILDDYEEGSITGITLTGSTGGSVSTSGTLAGKYVKIGDFVLVNVNWTQTSTTATGTYLSVNACLPFTPAGGAYTALPAVFVPYSNTTTYNATGFGGYTSIGIWCNPATLPNGQQSVLLTYRVSN